MVKLFFTVLARDKKHVDAKIREMENLGILYKTICGERLNHPNVVYRAPKGKYDAINFSISACYAIYEALEETPPDTNNEVQLTNAIQQLMDHNYPVYAVELDSRKKLIDIGNPRSYLTALNIMAKRQRA
jgi:UTP-glucose-1-phosphate uridylyltransferase